MAAMRAALVAWSCFTLLGCGGRTGLDSWLTTLEPGQVGSGGAAAGTGGAAGTPNVDAGAADAPPELALNRALFIDSEASDVQWADVAVAAALFDDGAFVAGGTAADATLEGAPLSSGGAFLLRLHASGELFWAASIRTEGASSARAVAATSDEGVVIGGHFLGVLESDSRSATADTRYGDVFVARYDSLGHLVWLRTFGSPSWDRIDAVTVSAEGRIFVGGYVGGPIDFGTGVLEVSEHEPFLLELDAGGSVLSAAVLPCSGPYCGVLGLAIANDEDLLVAGYQQGSLQIGDTRVGVNDAEFRAFALRRRPTGELTAAKAWNFHTGHTIAQASGGGVYVAGEMRGEQLIDGHVAKAADLGGGVVLMLDQANDASWINTLAFSGAVLDVSPHPRGGAHGVGRIRTDSGDWPFVASLSESGALHSFTSYPAYSGTATGVARTVGGVVWVVGSYDRFVSFSGIEHATPATSGFVLRFVQRD
jgi:hypothetical protein